MLIAMVPSVPIAHAELIAGNIDIDNDDIAGVQANGEKGHTIIITGAADSVSSGYEVSIYWDKIQTWNGEKGLLNTTEVDDDGGFEIWFEVPEATVGAHNIWYTATDQSTTARDDFDVLSDTDLSSSSGLADSKVYVDMWGYDDNEDSAIVFVVDTGAGAPEALADWNTEVVADEVIVADAGGLDQWNNIQLDHYPVDTAAGVLTITNGVDVLGTWNGAVWAAPGDGGAELDPADCTINEATGVLSFGTVAVVAAAEDIEADYTAGYPAVAGEATGENYAADEDEYEGTAENTMIEPKTFEVNAANGEVYDDAAAGDGKLYNDGAEKVGTIDYVTGEWTLDFSAAVGDLPAAGNAFTLDYEYIDDIGNYCYVLTASGLTNDLGSWENKRVTIPDATEDQYYIYGMDGDGNMAFDDFEIGAIITLSEDEGPVGSKVDIDGAGFVPGAVCTVDVGGVGAHIIDAAGTVDVVDADGEFSFSIIIPQVPDEDDYDITVTAGGDTPSAEYEVTDLASVSVDPDFGPQGSTVTVTGENFPNVKDTEVEIWLLTAGGADVIEIDTADTDSDGSFEIDVTVPTENDDPYQIEARVDADADGAFNIDDATDFRIGTILVLLSKDEAVVGDRIVLTGNGFTDNGEWNATFGDLVIFTEEQASATGLIKVDGETPEFFVPQVMPGDYTITVWDADAEIMLETDFTVTEYTTLEFSTLEAPNEFNVSLEGWYWPEVDGNLNANADIEFVLWNDTDEWDMAVKQRAHDNPAGAGTEVDPAVLNGTGFFNDAWWMVPDDDTLSKGTYNINATIETDNDQLYEMFLTFTVGDVHAMIAPRKSTFRVGDTVTFMVEHSFGGQAAQDVDAGKIVVYDPSGDIYWEIDQYVAGDWNKEGEFYTLMYSAQTDNGNPCVLLDDAPLGEWSYDWEDEGGDVVEDGTFTVEASSADIIGEQVADLNNEINNLADQLTDVTAEFDDVKSDIADVAAIAEQAVTAAQQAAEAVQTVAQTANTASQAASDAAEAANAARDAANGLTTLVYGAIGAALVAALAAIVSLMQISRRIAG